MGILNLGLKGIELFNARRVQTIADFGFVCGINSRIRNPARDLRPPIIHESHICTPSQKCKVNHRTN